MKESIKLFRDYFQEYDEQYIIIGGTACELWLSEAGLDFRSTKDIDLVLIVEVLDKGFIHHFWQFVHQGKYQIRRRNTGEPVLYRFSHPQVNDYPFMIELFSRKPEMLVINEDQMVTPIQLTEEISSLSAILLNKDYYELLLHGSTKIDGLPILDVPYLILFKAKAWIDLTDRANSGAQIDSRDIHKHLNDILRLCDLLNPSLKVGLLPESVQDDMNRFLSSITISNHQLKQLSIKNKTAYDILQQLRGVFAL